MRCIVLAMQWLKTAAILVLLILPLLPSARRLKNRENLSKVIETQKLPLGLKGCQKQKHILRLDYQRAFLGVLLCLVGLEQLQDQYQIRDLVDFELIRSGKRNNFIVLY